MRRAVILNTKENSLELFYVKYVVLNRIKLINSVFKNFSQ